MHENLHESFQVLLDFRIQIWGVNFHGVIGNILILEFRRPEWINFSFLQAKKLSCYLLCKSWKDETISSIFQYYLVYVVNGSVARLIDYHFEMV